MHAKLPIATLTTEEWIVPSQGELEQFFAELASKLISVQQAADASGFQPSHIRNLLVTQRLLGIKLGRDWWTTRDAVEMYVQSERRPGPKTD
ncbi:MAG: hypothetical protein KDE58_37600 [Caldilineaceae bacterium]|nr:hypothetical protein [Caldilineaceae bacterium]